MGQGLHIDRNNREKKDKIDDLVTMTVSAAKSNLEFWEPVVEEGPLWIKVANHFKMVSIYTDWCLVLATRSLWLFT